MKKSFLIFFVSFVILFLIFGQILAVVSDDGSTETGSYNPGLVPCNGPDCTINSFFEMLDNIFNFIVWNIATPLAILMLTIGGVMILISAGNPNLAGLGKKILWVSVIGLVLVFCSWLIVNFILGALGYRGAWNTL